MTGEELFAAVRARPDDAELRLVYADWLEGRGDRRADLVRLALELAPLPPDHPRRPVIEEALGPLRWGVDPAWLAVIEPDLVGPVERTCGCFARDDDDARDDGEPAWRPTALHRETQDTGCDAWKRLLELVERAAADGRTTFAPFRELPREDHAWIVTLPPTIGKLTAVRELHLYGSCLSRIPPEIGRMRSLRTFTPYTSYRLHWLPYEITRCTELAESTISTRALYGNFKHRPPFPALAGACPPVRRACSVCDRELDDAQEHRVWISLRVATDVVPLLVNACSEACLARLPAPPEGYVAGPHRGGAGVAQPPPRS